MLCAGFPRTQSFTLRSSADRPLPLLMPVAATVSETTKSHHACSAERADQITYSEDQARVGIVTTASEAIISLPVVAVLHRRMHNLKRGAVGAFWVGRLIGYGLRPRVRYRHEEQLSRQTPAVMNGKAESVEIACDNDGTVNVTACCIGQDFPQLRNAQRIASSALQMKVVSHEPAASNIDLRYQCDSSSESLLERLNLRQKPARLPEV